jgi:phage-related protein
MADATLIVRIITDATGAGKGFAAADSKIGKTQRTLGKMAAPAGAAILAIGAFGTAAVSAASRTQQAIGAVDSVFGKNAGTVKKWAGSAATDVGLAKSEYLELASVLGSQLKNMGVPLDQVAGKTKNLVTLGADLAATYGGTTKDAVDALGSALRGETDPIERYGVSIKQADIAAQQAKDGTDKLTGAAGKQAKTMALLELVNKQTADSQGQFAKESDSAAGSAQIASAQYENMMSTLGTALLPAVASVTAALGKLATMMAKHQTTTKIVIAVIAALAVGILALNVALGIYTAVTTLAASTTLAAWIGVAWPILAVIAAVALLVFGIKKLWNTSTTFRTVVLGVWGAVKSAASTAARVIKVVFLAAWRVISTAARAVGSVVRSVFNAVRGAVNAVTSTVGKLIGRIRGIKVPGVIKSAFDAVKSAIGRVIETAGNLIGKLKGIKVPGTVKTALDAIKGAADRVLNVIQSIINWLGNIPTPHINWPSPPKWLDKVIPGSFAAPSPMGRTVAGVGTYAAPTGRSARAVTPASSGGITINITGAVDPEATARQVRRLLGGHDRRMGARLS